MASRIVDLPTLFWPTSGVKSPSERDTSRHARKFTIWIWLMLCTVPLPFPRIERDTSNYVASYAPHDTPTPLTAKIVSRPSTPTKLIRAILHSFVLRSHSKNAAIGRHLNKARDSVLVGHPNRRLCASWVEPLGLCGVPSQGAHLVHVLLNGGWKGDFPPHSHHHLAVG